MAESLDFEILCSSLLKELGNVKNKKILDIGCGDGRFARELSKKGAKVTAIDIDKEILETAKSLSKDYKIDFRVMDGAELSDLDSGEYDFVIMNMVFIQVKKLVSATEIIDEVSRVLDEDGKLIFTDFHPVSFFKNNKLVVNGFNYFNNPSYFTIKNISDIEYSHYTIEGYLEMLDKASMYSYSIKELGNDTPQYLMFICKLIH